jgi:hypothetical protein
MTKPTGRPRGRPKTKAYVTLMARVPQEMADRVKRYAAAHRQPLSVVIRDALVLLMEEYPSGADRTGPHRLASQEFLSDRYESALDTLLAETDIAGLDELLSDTNEEVVETLLSEPNSGPDITSDTKADDADILSDGKGAQLDIASDRNADTPKHRAVRPPRAQSAKASDTKGGTSSILSDAKADTPSFLSDTKGGDRTPDVQEILPGMMSDMKEAPTESPLVPAILSDTNMPAFDTTKYVLGKLCPRSHDYHHTGQSLLRRANLGCLACDRDKARERRQAKQQRKEA